MRNNRTLFALASIFFGTLTIVGVSAAIVGNTTLALIVTICSLGAVGVLSSAVLISGRSATGRIISKVTGSRRKLERAISKRSRTPIGSQRGESTQQGRNYESLLEELNRSEFRIISALEERYQETDTTPESRNADEQIETVLRELTSLWRLQSEWAPTPPIVAGSPVPSVVQSLISALGKVRANRILALHLDEQALWLAYAMQDIELAILSTPGSSRELKDAIVDRGLDKRVEVLEVPFADMPIPHHYEPWFEFPEIVEKFDAFVFGKCDQSCYPAPYVLKQLATPSACFVLPLNHDRDVSNAWRASDRVKQTAHRQILTFEPTARS